MKYLFKDFLENKEVYLQTETYYKDLFKQIIGHEPKEYYNTQFASGKKFFNGNPIFNTKYNDRIVRIIQDEPESEEPYFHVRIEKTEDALEELVIDLELSEEIEDILSLFLKKWFKEKINATAIEEMLESYTLNEKLDSNIVSEPEITYKKSKNKFTEAIALYTKELEYKTEIIVDKDLLKAVTKACGPAIYHKDASKVSTSDPLELLRIKKNFLIKKLNLKDSPVLDAAIKEVGEQLGKSNRHKYRAIFYYLLVKKFKKESIFLK